MTTNGLTVSDPNGDGDLWIECECSACGYVSRGKLMHRRRCRTRAQYSADALPSQSPAADAAVSEIGRRLQSVAASVRATSMTGGRDGDVTAAVRAGYLRETDAMNTDD